MREGYVPVPGAQLYFRDVGTGPALVILHGGPDFNHRYLLPEMDRLSSAFRLLYYDQRGRGKSSRGVVPDDVGIESEVEDLDRIRRYFGLEAISLVGHSWGGLLAMEYAARRPDRVAHLVLMNTAPASYADRVRFREQRERNESDALARMRAISASPEYAAGDIETEADYYRAHFRAALVRPEQLERVVGSLRAHFTAQDILKARAIEDRLYAQTWLAPGYDLRPRLGPLESPTLVIHGDRDFVPLECSRNIADSVAGARLVVVPECGHFAFLERPVDVLEAMLDFVSRR